MTNTINTKTTTTEKLSALMEHRNELIKALEVSPLEILTAEKEKTVQDLCETIAQISVYKTLGKLSDSPKDISTSGAQMCEKLYRNFTRDMIIYKTNNATESYSDAFDLFNLAYMTIWEYLHTDNPLTLDDTVLTETKKNGNEKNYTLFQTACKDIRSYIRSWSKSDNYKKIRYVIGISDNGEIVTSSQRPQDDLTDISTDTIKTFFNRYNLTAREQEIMYLYIKGENAETIAELLNLNLRMVQRDIKTAKAKFTTASAYAELKTAQNAEKLAKAKAEKHPDDEIYQKAYTKAQERTAKALADYKNAFHKGA